MDCIHDDALNVYQRPSILFPWNQATHRTDSTSLSLVFFLGGIFFFSALLEKLRIAGLRFADRHHLAASALAGLRWRYARRQELPCTKDEIDNLCFCCLNKIRERGHSLLIALMQGSFSNYVLSRHGAAQHGLATEKYPAKLQRLFQRLLTCIFIRSNAYPYKRHFCMLTTRYLCCSMHHVALVVTLC